TNIEASNGIIHVIDAVMVPETRNLVEVASETEGFGTLVAAVQAAGLVETLADADAEFTVFAPTDDAFAGLLADLGLTAEELLANTSLLTDVLLYHVAEGRIYSDEVLSSSSIATVQGSSAPIVGTEIDGAAIVATDIQATNGVIHVIDEVILPPSE
ncbi:MAG TPA: fasciclin domain-containing protein, partial [Longimicrobiales bacterium]|nr:fasciclin domain-containing protein [Longimicrobiales bacterium]